jgi:hypothetical protein
VIKQVNPAIEEFKRHYPVLHGQQKVKQSSFLPMQVKKNEAVATHENSAEYQRLQRGKVHVAAISDHIKTATDGVLEPLDLDRLRQDAMDGIEAKARYRMRMEGVSQEQEELIIAEMRSVLEEKGATGVKGTDASTANIESSAAMTEGVVA